MSFPERRGRAHGDDGRARRGASVAEGCGGAGWRTSGEMDVGRGQGDDGVSYRCRWKSMNNHRGSCMTSTPMGDGGSPARERSHRQPPPSLGAKRRGRPPTFRRSRSGASRRRPLAGRSERWGTDDRSGPSPGWASVGVEVMREKRTSIIAPSIHRAPRAASGPAADQVARRAPRPNGWPLGAATARSGDATTIMGRSRRAPRARGLLGEALDDHREVWRQAGAFEDGPRRALAFGLRG